MNITLHISRIFQPVISIIHRRWCGLFLWGGGGILFVYCTSNRILNLNPTLKLPKL